MGTILKKLVGLAIGLIVVALVALIIVASRLDRIIEHAVETLGPEATGTSVTLDAADVSIWSGEGSLKGLVIDNPQGFESDYAFRLGRIDIAIDVDSLTEDVIIIDEIVVDRASLMAEQKGIDQNNLKAILDSVESYAGLEDDTDDTGAVGKRVIVRVFRFTNGELGVRSDIADFDELLPIPDLVVTDVGGKTAGTTIAEVFQQLLRPVINQALKATQQRVIDDAKERVREELEEEFTEQLKGILDGKDD